MKSRCAQRPHEAEEAETRVWRQLEWLDLWGEPVAWRELGKGLKPASGFPISPCVRAGLCLLRTPHEVSQTGTTTG